MSTELVKLDYKEFGIEETKAKEIASQFQPMLDKMVELETEANEVFSLAINDKEASKKAKEVRLKYVKVRTGTAEIHKNQKAFYLSAGRYVDGFKNVQAFASQGIEEKLELIEKHAENLEKQRISDLQESRLILISEFVDETTGLDLGNIPDEVFEGFLQLKKTQKLERLEAERLAEEKRIEEQKAEAERLRLKAIEDERVRQENAKLKADAEAKELALQKEREENERKAKEEKAKQDAILEKQRLDSEKLLAEEKAKSDKIAQELKAKQIAEAEEIGKRNAEILAQQKEAEKLAKAPIKTQMNVWIDSFEVSMEIPNELMQHEKTKEIIAKFNAFKSWAKSEIDKL